MLTRKDGTLTWSENTITNLVGDPRIIFLDKPTAGLDPEERNRFLNLLAEIGENVVVILSTHIVDDVTDLCPRMAILAEVREKLKLRGA